MPRRPVVRVREPRPDRLSLVGAAGLGAALMYFLDPDRGPRRRRLAADQLVHARHELELALQRSARDVRNRAQGVAAATRGRLVRDVGVDDVVVAERVRAAIGRVVDDAHAITVTVEDGRATLRGRVHAADVRALRRTVRGVRGVRAVDDQLQVIDGASENGSSRHRRAPMPTPAGQLARNVGGGLLALYGVRHGGARGALAGLAGAALLARGMARGGVHELHKTIDIARPVEDVFAAATDWASWPRWMSHVREVRVSPDARTTHWVVDGPAGTPVQWDAVVTELVPNERVAWRTADDADVWHEGALRFESREGGTRLHVRLAYEPPLGAVGHALALLFGRDPKHQMDDDLARFKTTLETGHPPRDAARPVEEPAAEASLAAPPRP